MISNIDVNRWTPSEVNLWLTGLCDDSSWLRSDKILDNNLNGSNLLLMTAEDLEQLGATKVNTQEVILDSIDSLRFHNFNVTTETLQFAILRLACLSRGLQSQLVAKSKQNLVSKTSSPKNVVLSSEFKYHPSKKKQFVSLDTLVSVSNIAAIVKQITNILNYPPFSTKNDYRSMKSLLLALSIELTSTAQRDQFVERPNDIIEKSAKALADYCDRIVIATKDCLLTQPFHLESVKIKKQRGESDVGLVVKSPSHNVHIIEKILPLSPAKKTNKLNEGDEVLLINQFIIGWSAKNVEQLLKTSSKAGDINMIVKKRPSE